MTLRLLDKDTRSFRVCLDVGKIVSRNSIENSKIHQADSDSFL
jgi:hypothetical protein